MEHGLFGSYCYKYDITKNGKYTFKYIGEDGKTGEITVNIDENNPCVVGEDRFDSTTYRLMAGVGNYLDFDIAKINNIVYKDVLSQEKNVDFSEQVFNGEIVLWELRDSFDGSIFDAEVILGYNGKEYSTKNSISLLPE